MKCEIRAKMSNEDPGRMRSEQIYLLAADVFEDLSSKISQTKQINKTFQWEEKRSSHKNSKRERDKMKTKIYFNDASSKVTAMTITFSSKFSKKISKFVLSVKFERRRKTIFGFDFNQSFDFTVLPRIEMSRSNHFASIGNNDKI